MRCALGYDLTEQTCPRAPCVECMKRLGAGVVRDLEALDAHRRAARARGEHEAILELGAIATGLSDLLAKHEYTLALEQDPITRTGYLEAPFSDPTVPLDLLLPRTYTEGHVKHDH